MRERGGGPPARSDGRFKGAGVQGSPASPSGAAGIQAAKEGDDFDRIDLDLGPRALPRLHEVGEHRSRSGSAANAACRVSGKRDMKIADRLITVAPQRKT